MKATSTAPRLPATPPGKTVIRAAAYARLSIASDREFSSVEAQVDAIRAYIASRAASGWVLAAEPFVDNGFTGANAERPALQRLLREVEAGAFDAVITVRLDRISRSTSDYFQIMATLQEHGVTFISTTQSFDATAVGMFSRDILAAVSQLERSMISERTREKLILSRRRGMFTGGVPTLGYRIENKHLIVVPEEAERVKQIFQLYLERRSILAVVDDVNRLGWRTKTHTRSDGSTKGGCAYSAEAIHSILTNATNCGLVRAGDELVEGAHEAIVDRATWQRVQDQLKTNRLTGGERRRQRSRALLIGMVRCGVCGHAMIPEFGGGSRKYGFYVCAQNRQRAAACPGSRIAMRVLDAAVVARIQEVARDPAIIASTIAAARRAQSDKGPELADESHSTENELQRLDQERSNLASAVADGSKGRGAILERLGSVEIERDRLTARLREIRAELDVLGSGAIDEADLRRVLNEFSAIWDSLVLEQRRRILGLLVERITFDSRTRELAIAFRAGGLRSLAERHEEKHG